MQTVQTVRRPQARPVVQPDLQLEENRRLRREYAHDAAARLLLDADSAIRRAAHTIARLFGR